MIKNINGDSIPYDIPYAILVESDVAVVVQHSRMDVSQSEMTLMTTMAIMEITMIIMTIMIMIMIKMTLKFILEKLLKLAKINIQ